MSEKSVETFAWQSIFRITSWSAHTCCVLRSSPCNLPWFHLVFKVLTSLNRKLCLSHCTSDSSNSGTYVLDIDKYYFKKTRQKYVQVIFFAYLHYTPFTCYVSWMNRTLHIKDPQFLNLHVPKITQLSMWSSSNTLEKNQL